MWSNCWPSLVVRAEIYHLFCLDHQTLTYIIVKVVWVVSSVENYFINLNSNLITVLHSLIMISHGNPQSANLHILNDCKMLNLNSEF